MEDGGWRGLFFTRHATRNMQPRLNVLLKTFLCLQPFGDDDNRASRKKVAQQHSEKWLGGWADAGTRPCAALLQSPREGLHSGSLRNGGEQVVHRSRGFV